MKGKKIELGPRNDPLGLSERALINLEVIEVSFEAICKGHVVTQLVQSLLTLIVFPKERQFEDLLKGRKLQSLANNPQWPHIQPTIDTYTRKTETLAEVLWHMRNAVCHRRIVFYGKDEASPDSRFIDDVVIEFSDQNDKGHKWKLTMDASDVRKFCILLDAVIRD